MQCSAVQSDPVRSIRCHINRNRCSVELIKLTDSHSFLFPIAVHLVLHQTIGIDFGVRSCTVEVDYDSDSVAARARPVFKVSFLTLSAATSLARHRTIRSEVYGDTQVLLIAYDVNNLESFKNCTNWWKQVQVQQSNSSAPAPAPPVVGLIAYKVDSTRRLVTVSNE